MKRALLAAACLTTACTPGHPAAERAPKIAPSFAVTDATSSSEVVDPAPTPPTTAITTTTTTVPEPVTEPPTTAPAPRRTTTTVAPVVHEAGSGACGGDLPPCWVMRQESGGNPQAVNPSSGAAGKWQFLPSTSRSLGYSRPMNEYDEATQDQAARTLWAGGRGCSAWDAC